MSCPPKPGCKSPGQNEKPPQPPLSARNKPYEPPLIEFPHFLRIIGPKHINILMQFIPSAIVYSATSLILLTYLTDWKAVLQYLPYYNGKFVEETETSTKQTEPEEEGEEAESK